jgi:UDPglucose 6-dehydrogenase
MWDFAHPSRIVVGVFPETTREHIGKLLSLFDGVPGPRLEIGVAAAELMKNVANGFLALKLSFVNEVATLAEAYAVEVDEILAGLGLDPRIGSAYMQPGLGFGGSCLPKELEVLATAGQREGLPMHVARAAARVNEEQQDRFARRVLRDLPMNARIGLLGLSFKGGTDDLRGSPAVHLARRLLEAGHRVHAFDPAVPRQAAMEAVPGIEISNVHLDVFRESHAVVIATDWEEFQQIDFRAARELVSAPELFDGRNLLDPATIAGSGFNYHGIGRTVRSAFD